jgi:hypothetical protein
VGWTLGKPDDEHPTTAKDSGSDDPTAYHNCRKTMRGIFSMLFFLPSKLICCSKDWKMMKASYQWE